MKELVFIFLVNFIFPLYSQTNDCERAKRQPPCYGECGNFIDLNKNGICDVWEKAHNSYKKEISKTKTAKTNTVEKTKPEKDKKISENEIKNNSNYNIPISTLQINKETENKKDAISQLKKFNLPYILTGFIILIILSEFLKKKHSTYLLYHKYFWNWLLLLIFIFCSISGIFLYLKLFSSIKNVLFKIHLITGFLFFIAGLYHIIERIKFFFKM